MEMPESEIITIILILFLFATFHNFKHFYLFYVGQHLKKEYPQQLSYNRFVEIEHRVFIPVMFFLNTGCPGKSTGISFVDSIRIALCINKRIRRNRGFKDIAKIGKSTTGRFYGFMLHLICNDKGELLSFCLTTGNIDDSNRNGFKVLMNKLFVKLFGDRGYISSSLFEMLPDSGIHPVTGIKSNMKNRLMCLRDRILLRKRLVIDTIHNELKNICQAEHSRHHSLHSFIMNLIAALVAYCFFDKKTAIRFERGQTDQTIGTFLLIFSLFLCFLF
jgi:hypothetical protein